MDLEAAFGALPGLTERVAQRRMAAAVAEALGTTSALAMGRGNYACYARIEALVAATRLAATREEEAALEVAAWAVDSPTGSRLDARPGSATTSGTWSRPAGRTARGSGAAPSSSAAS